MGELILKMSLSLDGFVAGPDGSLKWILDKDEGAAAWTVETGSNASLHIISSRSFQAMAEHWPLSSEVFAPAMTPILKAVLSKRGAAVLAALNLEATLEKLAPMRSPPRPSSCGPAPRAGRKPVWPAATSRGEDRDAEGAGRKADHRPRWEGQAFRARVEATARRQIVLSGIATNTGVAFTARETRRAGHEVFLVMDASATWSQRAETAAILSVTAAGVVPMSGITVAAELQHDWSLPGSEALANPLQSSISRCSAIAAGNQATVSQ